MHLAELLQNEDTLALLVMGTIALTWIVSATVAGALKTSAKEKSRREIAAFIAEGSISPEQGERLMRANDNK